MEKKEILFPLVSIIIPCRNEEKVIGRCLDSVLANDYPKQSLEIWVIDGMSEDGTRRIVGDYACRYPFIRLIDNPQRTQQVALNLGIKQSRGEIIIRMDAHSSFSPNYISQCVRYLSESGADNVGGRLITLPRENTRIGCAIALAMSEPFGVGNSPFRVRPDPRDLEPRWVTTVPYSCYRRNVFDRIGLFNEHLDRSEDAEFHQRMKYAGCRTLFVPSIVSYYYCRSDLRSFWEHVVDNGVWAILPAIYTGRIVVSPRSLVPLGFVTTAVIAGILAAVFPSFTPFFWGGVGGYGLVNVGVSCYLAAREQDFRYAVMMPLVFGLLHVGYGLGSIIGLWRGLFQRLTKVPGY